MSEVLLGIYLLADGMAWGAAVEARAVGTAFMKEAMWQQFLSRGKDISTSSSSSSSSSSSM